MAVPAHAEPALAARSLYVAERGRCAAGTASGVVSRSRGAWAPWRYWDGSTWTDKVAGTGRAAPRSTGAEHAPPPPPRERGIFGQGVRAGGIGCVGCATFVLLAVVLLIILIVVLAGSTSEDGGDSSTLLLGANLVGGGKFP
jgi:hypothetical protein